MCAAGLRGRNPSERHRRRENPRPVSFLPAGFEAYRLSLHNDRTLRYFPPAGSLSRIFFFRGKSACRLDSHEVSCPFRRRRTGADLHPRRKNTFGSVLMWVADVAALVSRQKKYRLGASLGVGESGSEAKTHVCTTGLPPSRGAPGRCLFPERIAPAVQADEGGPRILRHKFSRGSPPLVMQRPACSNAPRFSNAQCAGVGSPPRLTCCGFLFLPQRKIGRKGSQLSQNRFPRCAAPSLPSCFANTAAARGTDP